METYTRQCLHGPATISRDDRTFDSLAKDGGPGSYYSHLDTLTRQLGAQNLSTPLPLTLLDDIATLAHDIEDRYAGQLTMALEVRQDPAPLEPYSVVQVPCRFDYSLVDDDTVLAMHRAAPMGEFRRRHLLQTGNTNPNQLSPTAAAAHLREPNLKVVAGQLLWRNHDVAQLIHPPLCMHWTPLAPAAGPLRPCLQVCTIAVTAIDFSRCGASAATLQYARDRWVRQQYTALAEIAFIRATQSVDPIYLHVVPPTCGGDLSLPLLYIALQTVTRIVAQHNVRVVLHCSDAALLPWLDDNRHWLQAHVGGGSGLPRHNPRLTSDYLPSVFAEPYEYRPRPSDDLAALVDSWQLVSEPRGFTASLFQ